MTKLIEELRAKVKAALEERARRQAELDQIIAAAEERGDGALTDEEEAKLREIRERVRAIDSDVDEVRARIDELEEDERRRKAAEEAARRFEGSNPGERRQPPIQVTEPSTYRDGGPHSFFADAYRAFGARGSHDFEAAERLRRHQREMSELGYELRDGGESRAVGTALFGGLVVPQYLVDEFAPVLRNGRAFLNAVRREPLPDEGMTLVVPRGQTGVSVAAQATENAAVSETNIDYDNDLSVSVRTYAGQQDVSRQSLERGTPGIDRLLYADLVGAYAESVDADAINGAGTSGTHKGVLQATGINSVTYTDTTPTVAEAWPKLADAIQQVATNRKMSANLIVMHPRRWAWFVAALDGQNRPLIVNDPSAAVNAMGDAASNFGEGQLVGTLQGLPVLVDANIPTNLGAGTDEDRIIVLRRTDPILWEEGDGMPRELRFEETSGGNLTVKLVVYGYSAFTAERYASAVSVISGTGLVAPTF